MPTFTVLDHVTSNSFIFIIKNCMNFLRIQLHVYLLLLSSLYVCLLICFFFCRYLQDIVSASVRILPEWRCFCSSHTSFTHLPSQGHRVQSRLLWKVLAELHSVLRFMKSLPNDDSNRSEPFAWVKSTSNKTVYRRNWPCPRHGCHCRPDISVKWNYV